MPAKKTTRAKKVPGGKRPIGLTSAIGPKATTMVVILVLAGGIMVAARQQQTRAKEALADAARADAVLTPEPDGKKNTASSKAASTAEPSVPAGTAADATAAAKTPSMTVTGCLERTDEGFRMKDTAGADAPKSRSWKSGFIKKGSASIDVVDASHTLQFADLVGRRVSVTGTLVDREMRARSVRRLGSCKAN